MRAPAIVIITAMPSANTVVSNTPVGSIVGVGVCTPGGTRVGVGVFVGVSVGVFVGVGVIVGVGVFVGVGVIVGVGDGVNVGVGALVGVGVLVGVGDGGVVGVGVLDGVTLTVGIGIQDGDTVGVIDGGIVTVGGTVIEGVGVSHDTGGLSEPSPVPHAFSGSTVQIYVPVPSRSNSTVFAGCSTVSEYIVSPVCASLILTLYFKAPSKVSQVHLALVSGSSGHQGPVGVGVILGQFLGALCPGSLVPHGLTLLTEHL